jgi:hypothetical protein
MRSFPLLLLLLATPALAQDAAPAPAPDPAPAAAPAPATDVPAAPSAPAAEPAPAPDPNPVPPAPPPTAVTATATATAETIPAPPPPPPAVAPYPRFGLRFGVGFPAAVTADLVVRPFPYLRFHAGPAWNYVSWGVQGGIAVTPIRWYVSPVLEASYGHFFGGNLSSLYKPGPNDRLDLGRLLQKVGYDYLSGHLNLEFGSPRGACFSLGLGISYLRMDLRGTATSIPDPTVTDPTKQFTLTATNPSVRAVVPSLRLGLLFYF